MFAGGKNKTIGLCGALLLCQGALFPVVSRAENKVVAASAKSPPAAAAVPPAKSEADQAGAKNDFDPSGRPGFRRPDGEDRADRRERREHLTKEAMDQMRAMMMWRLTEELKLDESTAAKVFPALSEFDNKMRELGRERGDLMRALTAETQAPNPNAAKLKELVEKVYANRVRRNQLEDQKAVELRKALTPLQQAKLVLLMPRMADEFRSKMREAVDRARGPRPSSLSERTPPSR